jgi:hypothetical protein
MRTIAEDALSLSLLLLTHLAKKYLDLNSRLNDKSISIIHSKPVGSNGSTSPDRSIVIIYEIPTPGIRPDQVPPAGQVIHVASRYTTSQFRVR